MFIMATDDRPAIRSSSEILQIINDFQAQGRFHEALSHIDTALEALPDDLALRIRRGVLLRQLQRLDESIALLTDLQAVLPGNLHIKQELATSHRLAGNYRESRKLVGAILAQQPNHRGGLIARIDIATQQQLFDEALKYLDEVLETLPDDLPLCIRRGVLLRNLGRMEESRAHFMALQRDAPGSAEIMLEMARTLLAFAEPAAAIAQLDALLGCTPDHIGAHALRIAAAREVGNFTEAARLGEAAAARWPDHPNIALRRAEVCLAQGEPEAALAVLDALSEAKQQTVPVLIARANALCRVGARDAADALFTRVLAENGLHLGALAGRLRVAIERGPEQPHLPQVVAELLSLVVHKRNEQGHANPERFLAEIAFHIGDWQSLEPLCTELRKNQTRDAIPLFYLAHARFGLGNVEGAEAALSEFLALNPRHVWALECQANLALATGRPDDYLYLRQVRLAQSSANRISRHLQLSKDLHTLDRNTEALACLDQCKALSKAIANLALASELLLHSDHEGAETSVRRLRNKIARLEQDATSRETSVAELANLFDFQRPGTVFDNSIAPATLLAWRLCRERPASFSLWRARAVHATHARTRLEHNPAIGRACASFLVPPDVSLLAPLITARQPCLLVSSHLGPLVMTALAEYVPGLHYVANRGISNPASRTGGELISGTEDNGKVAAAIYRVLRRGQPVNERARCTSRPGTARQTWRQGQCQALRAPLRNNRHCTEAQPSNGRAQLLGATALVREPDPYRNRAPAPGRPRREPAGMA